MSHTCEFCGKEFKSIDELIKHIREEHKDKVKLRKFEHPKKGGFEHMGRYLHFRLNPLNSPSNHHTISFL